MFLLHGAGDHPAQAQSVLTAFLAQGLVAPLGLEIQLPFPQMLKDTQCLDLKTGFGGRIKILPHAQGLIHGRLDLGLEPIIDGGLHEPGRKNKHDEGRDHGQGDKNKDQLGPEARSEHPPAPVQHEFDDIAQDQEENAE